MSILSPAARRTLMTIHRWTALVFALPLAVLILTGALLSFEPVLHAVNTVPGSLEAGRVAELLDQHDPEGRARALIWRSYDGTLEIAGVRPDAPLVLDPLTGEPRALGALATAIRAAHNVHINLIGPLNPLVIASTAGFLVLATLGLLLGWPRFRNSLSGWHRGTAWLALPLLLLAPVTGLLISANITFGGGGSAPMHMGQMAQPMSLRETVLAAGAQTDLSGMVWMRAMGPRTMMRYTHGPQFQGYFVTAQSLVPVPRNLPRAIHEGLMSVPGLLVVNLALSLASMLLWVTGLWLWLSRRRRRA